MTSGRHVRTIVSVSDPYTNFLVPVPPPGDGVCRICRTAVYGGYELCYPCHTANAKFGVATADAVGIVSLAPAGEQFARELYTYKRDSVPWAQRSDLIVGLAAVLWRWLGAHERCVARAAGIDRFPLITSVPSTSGRVPDHPMRTVVKDVVTGTADRYADLLETATPGLGRETSAQHFRGVRTLRGEPVLIIDDVWTTGTHAQSAAVTLRDSGAGPVAIVALGRWFVKEHRDNNAWLANVKKDMTWRWDRCCL